MSDLKRYAIETQRVTNNNGIIRERYDIRESHEGAWCKYEEVKDLSLRIAVAVKALADERPHRAMNILTMTTEELHEFIKNNHSMERRYEYR